MKRFFVATLAALMVLGAAGCGQSKAPLALESSSSAMEDASSANTAANESVYVPGECIVSEAEPQTALEEIYTAVREEYPLMEFEDVTDTALLSTLYGISADSLDSFTIRRSNGKFGISDVLILQPKEGQTQTALTALEKVQQDLVRQVENYDVYDAVEIASQSMVFQQGDYVILLALKDNIAARQILDKYVPY